MTNCWIHGTGQEPSNKKLETVEIKREGDYVNNVKLALAPSAEELYYPTLKLLQAEKVKTNQLQAQITTKEQRITQLDGLMKGSVLIFQKQQQVIDQLIQTLNKEIDKNEIITIHKLKLSIVLIKIITFRINFNIF